MSLASTGLSYGKEGFNRFGLLPTELTTQIFETVAVYHDIESGKEYLDVGSLSTLLNVCAKWANIALFIAKIRPHFRFNELCDVSVLHHMLKISHPNLISIALSFPKRLTAMPYWNFLIALFQYSGRFIDFSVSTVPSNYIMLSKNLLSSKFSALETLSVVRIKEKDLNISAGELKDYGNRQSYIIIPKLDIDTSKLRHLQLDGIEWKGPKEGRQGFSRLDSVYIRDTFVDWLSMSVFAKQLTSFTVSEMSSSAFLLRDTISQHPESMPVLSYLRIDECAPSWIFDTMFIKTSIKTLVLSNMTSTHWINILRYIQVMSSDSSFSGVKLLEVSFVDGAAAYAATTQMIYSRFYQAFENLESLVVLNVHRDTYFLRPLKLNSTLCPSLRSIEINGRRILRNNLGFNT